MIIYYAVIFGVNYLIKITKINQIKKYKNKIIAVILIIALIPNLIEIFPNKNLKIYFIDVGQGDSCLIVTPNNKKILIDGGGSETYDIRKEQINSVFVKSKNK